MIDPLLNKIDFTTEGIGIANLERGDVKDHLIRDIQKTLAQPVCIYESNSLENTRYYFQYFKATIFMCIAKKDENGWFLADTLYNPEKDISELILLNDKLLYAK